MPGTRPAAGPPHWLAYVGLAVLVIGAVFNIGFAAARLDGIDGRVTVLEASSLRQRSIDDARAEKIETINARTARMEGVLEKIRVESKP